MTPLQSELRRLYLTPPEAHAEAGTQPSPLTDPLGQTRAMVMELTRPASWELLSKVWHGVQNDLELPAPAIAVSGTDGLQLWFSLADAIDASQAHVFLERLRSRFLPEVDPGRLRSMPSARGHAALVPARQGPSENWSAFVAPDLAPVFGDTPWLDIPPSEEGQAALLRGVRSMLRPEFAAALKRLMPSTSSSSSSSSSSTSSTSDADAIAVATDDPRRFLLQAMNDGSVAMALRIEAAKALLQHAP
jgi:hypothetical protein